VNLPLALVAAQIDPDGRNPMCQLLSPAPVFPVASRPFPSDHYASVPLAQGFGVSVEPLFRDKSEAGGRNAT